MKKSKIKAIIFDFDGVLLESEVSVSKTVQKVFKKNGINISLKVVEEYSGTPYGKKFPAIAKQYGVKIDTNLFISQQSEMMHEAYKKGLEQVPYIKDVLKKLYKKYKLGVATTAFGSDVREGIKSMGATKYFDAVVSWDDIQVPKPDPGVYLLAAKKLRVRPELAVGIEDTEPGFKSVKAAGMKLIARKAKHNKQYDFSQADFVITDAREILKILETL